MTDREKIMSDDYLGVLADYTIVQSSGKPLPVEDYVYQPIDTDFGIYYIDRNDVMPINVYDFTYGAIPKLYGLMQMPLGSEGAFDPNPLLQSGILQVQRDPLNLTGRGVVIGFLDTGIRYDDAVFRKPDGSSRILGIWDQTIQTGEPPAGLLYGTEYKKGQIDAALASENPREIVPSYDEDGHGTAIASVAAGSSVSGGLRFLGAAPEADIAVVKLKQAKTELKQYYLVPDGVPAYAESDLMTAVKYLESFAISLIRPLVICIGLGTNMGGHDGNSILSAYLNVVATRRNRAVVVCGGNEGNSSHHYAGYAVDGVLESTENVEIRVDQGETGFTAELWGSIPSTHAIAIRSPGGESTARVDFKDRESREFSFVYERTRIRVNHVLVEQRSGEELIFFRFEDPTPGVWTIQVTVMNAGGRLEPSFHMWLPITSFLKGNTYFLRPSPYITLTEPGNTREGITTSIYQDDNNSFYGESGRGFTRMGGIKPDLCTPGVDIHTILGSRTGSSMGAAILSGACAQFMQWAVVESNRPWVESREIKNYLIRGAVRSPGQEYPSREWGYGRLDIAGTFETLAGV